MSNSKVLITGAGGFIGSHLVEACLENGYAVRAFLRYNSQGKRGWLEDSEALSEIEVFAGDIRDYDSVFQAVEGCRTVFHLAALVGIPFSQINPLSYVQTNIGGAYNVLQAAKNLHVPKVLMTSTSEVYGKAESISIDEAHPVHTLSPYAASKISADHLALSFCRSFGLPVGIVRPFNAYGPRQSARAVIPTVISQIIAGNTCVKLGNLHPARDFTYVTDLAEGFLAVEQSEKLIGDVVHIGTNTEISVKKLTEKIAALMGAEIHIVQDAERVRPEESEVKRLRCDNTKIMRETGWKPLVDFTTGLENTIKWFRENQNSFSPDIYLV
jgi:NAD dependent epimerase/dehydratase